MREFDLVGPIVSNDDAWMYEWFEMEHTAPKMVDEFLSESNGEDVVVNINSGGGSLYDGLYIREKLANYKGNVEIRVLGLAASAASVIATAGRCYIGAGSQLMIHCASCSDYGNKHDKKYVAGMLDVSDKSIAELYSRKSGKPVEEFLKLMDKETFLTATQSLELGLVDGILGDKTTPSIENSVSDVKVSFEAVKQVLRELKSKTTMVLPTTEQEPTEPIKDVVEPTETEPVEEVVDITTRKQKLDLYKYYI